jgi:hypothetical protein
VATFQADQTIVKSEKTLSFTGAFPSFPCKPLCSNYEAMCAEAFSSIESLRPNCSKRVLAPSGQLDSIPDSQKTVFCNGTVDHGGQEDFPVDTTWFAKLDTNLTGEFTWVDANGTERTLPRLRTTLTLETQCNSLQATGGVNAVKLSNVEVVCLYPTLNPLIPDRFGRVGDANTPTILGSSSCAVPCPPPVYTDDQYEAVRKLFVGMTIIGTIFEIWLTITFIIFPEMRDKRYVLYFLACTIMVSIGNLISALPKASELVTCKSGAEDATTTNSAACVAQGVILHYFSLAAVTWWCVQGLHVLIDIVVKQKVVGTAAKIRVYLYHFMAWGYPLINVIACLALKSYRQFYALHFCFASDYNWGFYFAPILFYLLIGWGSMLGIMAMVIKSQQGVVTNKRTRKCQALIRPIMFILMFFVIFLFIFIYRVYFEVNKAPLLASTMEWIQCNVADLPLARHVNGDMSFSCGARPKLTSSFAYYVIVHIAVAGQGIFVMLTYGTQWRLYELWLDKLGLCKASAEQHDSSSDGSQLSKENSKKNLKTATSAVKLTNQKGNSQSGKAERGSIKPNLNRVVSGNPASPKSSKNQV